MNHALHPAMAVITRMVRDTHYTNGQECVRGFHVWTRKAEQGSKCICRRAKLMTLERGFIKLTD